MEECAWYRPLCLYCFACLEIWVLPKFPQRHFTEHNGVYPTQLYYNTWGDQEDDGDDDVNKLQKIIHHFFFLMKILSVSHNKTKRFFFKNSILFYFNSIHQYLPPSPQKQFCLSLKIVRYWSHTNSSHAHQEVRWPGHAPCFIKLMAFKVL
jgi:hypothetical protein